MRRTALKRSPKALRRSKPLGRGDAALARRTPLKRSAMAFTRQAISPASPAQRAAVSGRACVVTGDDRQVDAAHLIPRRLTSVGQDDPRAVVPLRRDVHRAYDDGDLDLLPFLEPHYRAELAFAVERLGLLPTLRQVTGQRWTPGGRT